MFHDFVNWIREDLGRFTADGQSWSQQLQESLFMWNVIEGTHVLTIMFFAGTIWIIDLRMMGVAFAAMPFSRLNDKVLPITVVSFAAMIVTGLIVFIGRDPLMYYHNIWFRMKMLFLIVAVINIFWFHYALQKSQAEWDAMPSPPPARKPWGKLGLQLGAVAVGLLLMIGAVAIDLRFNAEFLIRLTLATLVTVGSLVWLLDSRTPYPPMIVKASGAISMTSWFLIIIFGRFIAYDWFYCEKVEKGSLMYALEECKQALSYLEDIEQSETGGEGSANETPAEGAVPADAAPADGASPAEPAPTQPVPGQGG